MKWGGVLCTRDRVPTSSQGPPIRTIRINTKNSRLWTTHQREYVQRKSKRHQNRTIPKCLDSAEQNGCSCRPNASKPKHKLATIYRNVCAIETIDAELKYALVWTHGHRQAVSAQSARNNTHRCYMACHSTDNSLTNRTGCPHRALLPTPQTPEGAETATSCSGEVGKERKHQSLPVPNKKIAAVEGQLPIEGPPL